MRSQLHSKISASQAENVMSQKPMQVLLIDDHEVVRHGLRALVAGHSQYQICGEAADGRTGVRLAHELKPDLVVMDISMPGMNGQEATRLIREKCPNCEVLILSMHQSEHLIGTALSAGARGYVLKSDAALDLIAGLDSLRLRKPFFSGQVADIAKLVLAREAKAAGLVRRAAAGELTGREREILQLLAEGHTNKSVAKVLRISVKTAETHRARIMRKLQVDSVANLVRYAIRNQVIEP